MGQWLERFRTVKGKAWLEDPPERKPPPESASPIKVGSSVWYRLPGKPEVGPCQVTSLNDLGWHMVQIQENEKWAWVHRGVITRVG